MHRFPDLIERHRVDPGRLVHVGAADGLEVSRYYEAGFSRITVIDPDPARARALRTRFPGVETDVTARLDADAQVLVIRHPAQARALLASAPWGSLAVIVARASTFCEAGPSDPAGRFVEVERWTRDTEADPDVVFMCRPLQSVTPQPPMEGT